VSFTSAGVDVTFRYDGQTTGPVHVTTTSVTGAGALNTIRLGYGPVSNFAATNLSGQLEAPQLTAELAAGTWNDGFVQTAKIGPASPDLLDDDGLRGLWDLASKDAFQYQRQRRGV